MHDHVILTDSPSRLDIIKIKEKKVEAEVKKRTKMQGLWRWWSFLKIAIRARVRVCW